MHLDQIGGRCGSGGGLTDDTCRQSLINESEKIKQLLLLLRVFFFFCLPAGFHRGSGDLLFLSSDFFLPAPSTCVSCVCPTLLAPLISSSPIPCIGACRFVIRLIFVRASDLEKYFLSLLPSLPPWLLISHNHEAFASMKKWATCCLLVCVPWSIDSNGDSQFLIGLGAHPLHLVVA